MTKKKRRHMRVAITLSIMIAAVPLSLAFLFNEGNEPRISMDFLKKEKTIIVQPTQTGKILPILANN
jgi:hypothetical protein